jgi:hypothetical protein
MLLLLLVFRNVGVNLAEYAQEIGVSGLVEQKGQDWCIIYFARIKSLPKNRHRVQRGGGCQGGRQLLLQGSRRQCRNGHFAQREQLIWSYAFGFWGCVTSFGLCEGSFRVEAHIRY